MKKNEESDLRFGVQQRRNVKMILFELQVNVNGQTMSGKGFIVTSDSSYSL